MPGGWGRTKPPAGLGVDWGHPLAYGLSVALPLNDGGALLRDASGNNRHASVSGGSWGASAHGAVLVHDASSHFASFGPNAGVLPTTEGFTAVVGYRKRDATNRDSGAFGVYQGDDASRCGAHFPYSDGTIYFDYGGFASGTTRLAVGGLAFGDDLWALTVGARGMEVWQNGVRRGSNAASPARTASADDFRLGVHSYSPSDLADYWLFLVYKRQLAEAEIVRLGDAPFDLFWKPRSWWSAAAAAAFVPPAGRRDPQLIGLRGY